LHELFEDPVMEVESEAYVSALLVYRNEKVSDKGLGLNSMVDEMAKRFASKNSKKNKA
jgi:hypothetical protein